MFKETADLAAKLPEERHRQCSGSGHIRLITHLTSLRELNPDSQFFSARPTLYWSESLKVRSAFKSCARQL